MQDDTASKTGENIYRRSGISLNEVTFNGNKGVFYERDKKAKKDEKTGKYPKEQITKDAEPFDVVFLKIRRVLSVYAKKGGKRTNEHNHKNEMVVLYKPEGKEYGIAADLREKYKDLRTQQVVYAYLPERDEVVRLTIKGASLGSEAKHPEGTYKFYDYLQSFEKDQHSHQFVTTLTPVEEEGPQGTYYALTFVRGRELDEEELAKVKTLIDQIHSDTQAIDERLRAGFGKAPAASQDAAGEEDTGEADEDDDDEGSGTGRVEYPTEDINPDDIPF